jgi:two-component system invasion response regulator UvrY
VFLVDDHAMVRAGLKKVIEDSGDLRVIGEAADCQQALDRLRTAQPHCIVLDISLPGRSGLDLLKDIRSLYPAIRVIVLTMHPEDRFAFRALKNGASGYLTKDAAPLELVQAIRHVNGGRKYVSATLAEQLAASVERGEDAALPHERLSDREFEVLRQLAAGKSVHEIAEQLSLSISTVSTYRTRILEKMGLKSNSEIVRYGIDFGLVD